MDTYNDYLEHHGIIGMKWGVRNGPPYPLSAGRKSSAEKTKTKSSAKATESARVKRLKAKLKKSEASRKQLEKEKEEKAKAEEKAKNVNSGKLAGKNPAKLNDSELNTAINRRENEKKLMSLNSSSITNGRAFIKSMLAVAGTVALTKMVTGVATHWGENMARRVNTELLDSKQNRAKAALEAGKAAAEAATAARRQKDLNAAWRAAQNMPGYEKVKNINDYNAWTSSMRTMVNHIMMRNGWDAPYKN